MRDETGGSAFPIVADLPPSQGCPNGSRIAETGMTNLNQQGETMDAPVAAHALPELKEGEKLAFSITPPDGKTIHTILLPGDEVVDSWDAGMEWAKSLGGDLPDRVEHAMFFKYMPEEFQQRAYWSNTQHAAYSNYAWYHHFLSGDQYDRYKSARLRARAVRRVAI